MLIPDPIVSPPRALQAFKRTKMHNCRHFNARAIIGGYSKLMPLVKIFIPIQLLYNQSSKFLSDCNEASLIKLNKRQ